MVSMDCETSGLADTDCVHVVSLYDGRSQQAVSYTEASHGSGYLCSALAACAAQARVVTFNGTGFDYRMISNNVPHVADKACAARLALSTVDVMLNFACDTGYFSSLSSFATGTLNEAKSGDGAEAVDDWAAGRHAKVIKYCEHDAALTHALYDHARMYGRLTRITKAGRKATWVCSANPLRPTVQALTEYEQSPPDTSWMKDGTAPDINGIADWAVDILAE